MFMKKKLAQGSKIEKIDMLVFPRAVYVTDCDPNKFNELFKAKDGNIVPPDNTKSFASVYDEIRPTTDEEYGIVMWVNSDMKLYPDELAHEICHIVDHIYNYVGAYEIDLGGEQHAYFFQYAYRLVYDKLEKLGRIHTK